ncbi:MAG: site-specific integrase [Desulfotalea sp.]
MSKWISAGKDKYGLKYREHDVETVGAGKNIRPLRYYKTVFKQSGRTISDVFGWEQEFRGGKDTIEKIALELKINRKSHTPPFSYREMIEDEKNKLAAENEERKLLQQQQFYLATTLFSTVFENYILSKPQSRTFSEMKGFYQKWIHEVIGQMRLADIKLSDLQKIQKAMEKLNRAPRTIKTIKEIVRQVYNFAQEHDIYAGTVPYTNFLKKLKLNNKREAYYTHEQAQSLLHELKKRSHQTYCISLLSLNTGMRFGEIAGLLWQHINLKRRAILVLDPKNGENRTVHMVDRVLEMFQELERKESDELIFPSNTEKKMTKISNTFPKTIEVLGINRGISDRRLRLGFHSLRHTAASWMANQGVEMHIIARVLGHKTLAMTMRYSHINDKTVKKAMSVLENSH